MVDWVLVEREHWEKKSTILHGTKCTNDNLTISRLKCISFLQQKAKSVSSFYLVCPLQHYSKHISSLWEKETTPLAFTHDRLYIIQNTIHPPNKWRIHSLQYWCIFGKFDLLSWPHIQVNSTFEDAIIIQYSNHQ